jgi:hypothetical protein
MAMGDALAEKVKVVLAEANIEVDVVIPVRTFLFLSKVSIFDERLGS